MLSELGEKIFQEHSLNHRFVLNTTLEEQSLLGEAINIPSEATAIYHESLQLLDIDLIGLLLVSMDSYVARPYRYWLVENLIGFDCYICEVDGQLLLRKVQATGINAENAEFCFTGMLEEILECDDSLISLKVNFQTIAREFGFKI